MGSSQSRADFDLRREQEAERRREHDRRERDIYGYYKLFGIQKLIENFPYQSAMKFITYEDETLLRTAVEIRSHYLFVEYLRITKDCVSEPGTYVIKLLKAVDNDQFKLTILEQFPEYLSVMNVV